jgi:hypothetical protein
MRWRYLIGYALLIAVVMWGCSSCGYNGSYRYPCQDPTNWSKPECEPPLCNPSGTCTRDLIYETTTQA